MNEFIIVRTEVPNRWCLIHANGTLTKLACGTDIPKLMEDCRDKNLIEQFRTAKLKKPKKMPKVVTPIGQGKEVHSDPFTDLTQEQTYRVRGYQKKLEKELV